MAEKPQKEDCGCTHREGRWVQLCAKHEAEWREVHERAAADHRNQKEVDDLLS